MRKKKVTPRFELDFQDEVKASQLQKGSKKKKPLGNEIVLEPMFDDSDEEMVVDESDEDDDDTSKMGE